MLDVDIGWSDSPLLFFGGDASSAFRCVTNLSDPFRDLTIFTRNWPELCRKTLPSVRLLVEFKRFICRPWSRITNLDDVVDACKACTSDGVSGPVARGKRNTPPLCVDSGQNHLARVVQISLSLHLPKNAKTVRTLSIPVLQLFMRTYCVWSWVSHSAR